jgi:growth arrest-specific protein 8
LFVWHLGVTPLRAFFCWFGEQSLEREIEALAEQHRELEEQFAAMETERNSLYDNFEATIDAVKRRSEFRNVLL